jgi:cardiolipin synthase A/B
VNASTGLPDADDAAWAARIADRLPSGDVHRLSAAAAAGTASVRALRAQAAASVLRSACDQLLTRMPGAGSAYLAGLLAGAASAYARARAHQQIDVVWTGPETAAGAGRLTSAVIIDLINQARRELLLVTYASNSEPAIEAALAAAGGRGVEITLLAESHDDNPHYSSIGTPFPGLDAIRLRWPSSLRPHGAALHAKIIVVDDDIALVGSANFTGRAMASNLECGILLRGGPYPKAIRDHVGNLWSRGYLRNA